MKAVLRLPILRLTLALFVALVGLTVPTISRAASPSISVEPIAGAVVVQWKGMSLSAGQVFVVESSPGTFTCRTSSLICSVPVTATYPILKFRVKQLSGAGALVAQSPWSKTIKTTHLFVVAGQSNAAGFAAETKVASEKFNLWSGPGRNGADTATDFVSVGCLMKQVGPTPQKLNTPQVYTTTKATVFGPEVGIARTLWSAGWKNVAISKVTCGGTDLEHFWYQGSDQFTLLLTTTIGLENWYAAHGTVAVLSGAFWVQGETDSQDLATANDYFLHANDLIASIRAATFSVPTFPIIAGSIDMSAWIRHTAYVNGKCLSATCLSYEAGNNAVRAADIRLANENANTYVVDTAGLPRDPVDFVHITSPGMLRLGNLLGAKLLKVAKR